MIGKRFVIADIHGRIEALKEVLKLCNFRYDTDQLIVLGDVVDGGSNTYEVIEELLKINNLIYIFGNHDRWLIQHMENGFNEEVWLSQGGRETLKSYEGKGFPITHQHFFNNGVYYHRSDDNIVFVHGGFNPKIPLKNQKKEDLLWDRDLIKYARDGHIIKPYEYVFVGHTTTQTYKMNKPIRFMNLFMMDCGCGWDGKLAIMDVDSKEFWLSDRQDPVRTATLTPESYQRFLNKLR